MNPHRLIGIALLSLATLAPGALAHEGHAEATPLWHGVHGETWSGQLITLTSDAQVTLRQADGGILRRPLADFAPDDRASLMGLNARIRRQQALAATEQPAAPTTPALPAPPQAAPFQHAADQAAAGALAVHWDADYLYVSSNGVPNHTLMVGIRAWQQQVPLPQAYQGDNAWRIPLKPVPATDKPLSLKEHFFRGAVAVAANGIPIFNPIKNDGKTDTSTAGELDEFGGHCGRGDDYHYHIAPLHLAQIVGKGQPVAYALDGYPIYGLTESDGGAIQGTLDDCHGHVGPNGDYHYHASKAYPYLLSAFHGKVTEKDGQVDPQPRAASPRPALPPLPGAVITGFLNVGKEESVLTYTQNGKEGKVRYLVAADKVDFTFTAPDGKITTASYPVRAQRGDDQGGPGGKPRDKAGGWDPREHAKPAGESSGDPKPPPRDKQRDKPGGKPAGPPAPPPAESGSGAKTEAPSTVNRPSTFILGSSAFADKGAIPEEFTGDGAGLSPPLAWSGAPEGTQSFALLLWHVPHLGEKPHSYWVVYDIPADVKSLAKGATGVGRVGLNDKRRAEYDPMKSKGPGVKEYHITLYALSAKPELKDQATRDDLLKAIKDITLGETTLHYTYDRTGKP